MANDLRFQCILYSPTHLSVPLYVFQYFPFSNIIPCSFSNRSAPLHDSIALSTPPIHLTNHAKLVGSPLIIHLITSTSNTQVRGNTYIQRTTVHKFLHLVYFQLRS